MSFYFLYFFHKYVDSWNSFHIYVLRSDDIWWYVFVWLLVMKFCKTKLKSWKWTKRRKNLLLQKVIEIFNNCQHFSVIFSSKHNPWNKIKYSFLILQINQRDDLLSFAKVKFLILTMRMMMMITKIIRNLTFNNYFNFSTFQLISYANLKYMVGVLVWMHSEQ